MFEVEYLKNGVSYGQICYRILIGNHRYTDRSVSVPMTLSDLERPDARNHFFQADLNNAG